MMEMKVLLGITLGVLLSSSTMAKNPAELVVEGNNQFTNDLYKTLSAKRGNVFFSPISVHAVLSMAFQGAQGATAKLFASALKIPSAKDAAEGYNTIMTRLNAVDNVTLLIANKIFLKTGATLITDFHKAVTEKFLSEVELVDFEDNEGAAKIINNWVEEKTQEKIKDLIQKELLDELTRLVLVNAIYFKGNWKHKFNVDDTKIEPFYLNDVESVDVSMMHIKRDFRYKADEELDAQILELPYSNENISMIIILPNSKTGIIELEKKLENATLESITEGMYETEVNVALPKFKIEQTMDLKDALTNLGLGEIFDKEKANFRGMIPLNPQENLYVSKVIQKAFIEVNEEGAEAAAATGIVMAVSYCARISPEKYFVADHPFIFLLLEKNVLFVGKMVKP